MRIARLFAFLAMLVMLVLVSQGAVGQEDKQEGKPEQAARSENAGVKKSLNVYRLDFVLSEFVDGKKVNTRSYSAVAREDEMNKLRTGARYPVATETVTKITQYQYLDIGVNIDCRVVERSGYLELNAVIDSSSISWPEGAEAHGVPGQPFVSQMRSEIRSLIRPGVPTMISSMEDPASKRRFQVDVTATKAN